VLDRVDRHFFPGDETREVIESVKETLQRDGIALGPVAPDVWSGRAPGPVSYGLVPRASVALTRVREGFFVDLRVSADLDSTAIIILVVAVILFWPAALVLAFLGYQDFQNRASVVMSSIWAPLSSRIGREPSLLDLPGRRSPPE
jgi:hypothetical protein